MHETIFPRAIPASLGPDEPLYFLHIAKTAGRSFEDLLKGYYPAEQITRIDVEKGYPRDLPAGLFRNYRLYLGHLGYHFLGLFPSERRPAWVTMLREPVERVVSYYYFFRNVKPVQPGHISFRHQELACNLSLLGFVESEETQELIWDYQFNNLVDSEMLYFHPESTEYRRQPASPAELMRLVKQRLQSECLFFGLTEQYERSVELLCHTLNWEPPAVPLPRLNVTPEKPKVRDVVTAETLAAIRKGLELDLELYDFACELFEKRWEAVQQGLAADGQRAARQRPISAAVSPAAVSPAPVEPSHPQFTPPDPGTVLDKAWLVAYQNSCAHHLLGRLLNGLRRIRYTAELGLGIRKRPALFDARWYLEKYPDVAQRRVDPYVHYLLRGWREGRNPGPNFDALAYLSSHPDALRSGMDPLEHYLRFGVEMSLAPAPLPVQSAPPVVQAVPTPAAQGPDVPVPNFAHLRTAETTVAQPLSPRLCFAIPASPNDAFCSQIAMFRLSLDSMGGIYREAEIHVTFGDGEIKPVPERWGPYLGRKVKFNWVEPEEFNQHRYDAQGDAQWRETYEGFDFVLICDADTLLLQPIDDLLMDAMRFPGVTATIAHFPLPVEAGKTPWQVWDGFARDLIARPLEFGYRHTLMDGAAPEFTFCPFYVNFGFILITPDVLRRVGATHITFRRELARRLKMPDFAAQASIPLMLAAHQIPTRAVGLRYNFPNDPLADSLHLNELRDVRLIHYLRTRDFDRQKIFTSDAEFDRFLALDLKGSSRVFQEYVRHLTGGRYPF